MKKAFFLLSSVSIILFTVCQSNSDAFSRIVSLVFDNEVIEPDDLQEVFETIKKNKKKNERIKNPKKLKPEKIITIQAKLPDPRNIQLEVDTSQSIVKSDDDIQAEISNQAFLDSVNEAIMLWQGVDIADIRFLPLKFASVTFNMVNPEDGKNVITFRTIEEPEGVAEGSPVVTIVNYARTDMVQFMNKIINVKPGAILDADIVFDAGNDPCLAFFTTTGDFKIGGDSVATVEGGIDPEADVSNCERIIVADLTDYAVRGIGTLLGFDGSPITSSAHSDVAQNMMRYLLTNDDRIALANLYPNKENLTNHGILTGRVLLDKKPVRGAHIVIEDPTTGEPITSTITNLAGRFKIIAIPAGIYNVYAEPLDGPIRPNSQQLNFFGLTPELNFTTSVYPTPIIISHKKRTNIKVVVKPLSASAFNINYLTGVLTEADVNEAGGAFILPIMIMPSETITDVQFWGDNIATTFGSLSVSGSGVSVSNVRNASIPISPFVECSDCEDTADTMCDRDPRCLSTQEITKEPDQIQGIIADITCAAGTLPGPRNIIFTGEQLNITNPSFGLRDQITGGLVVIEE